MSDDPTLRPASRRPAGRPHQRHHVVRELAGRIAEGDSYGLVLIMLLALFALTPMLGDTSVGRILLVAISSGVLLIALRTSRVSRRTMHVAYGIVAAHVLIGATHAVPGVQLVPHQGVSALGNQAALGSILLTASLLAWTPIVILRRIFAHREVAIETVLGAICVYILIGMAWSYLYILTGIAGGRVAISGTAVTEAVQAAGLKGAPFAAAELQFLHLYFSFVTLTTVGYGDLTPATDFARSLVMLEALVGQLFLATTVARFVGVFRPRSDTEPLDEGDDDDPATAVGDDEAQA